MKRHIKILLSTLILSFLSLICISQPVYSAGNLESHFIDVGQGDSILIRALSEDITILIDAGDNRASQIVISYLKQAGVRKIDYLIATHPHSDHIGGLPDVIRAFPIGGIYMPRATHTTCTYEDLLLAIREKGMRITEAKAGVKLTDSPDLQAFIVGPVGTGYDNLNDYSAVLLVRYRNTAFIFTGDAETHSENEMVQSGVSLKADVLKIGHHGSRTSTSVAFLEAVNPSIAVIMSGQGNSYGHPHPETLRKLQQAGITVYRTDLQGNIVISSDGDRVYVSTQRTVVQPTPVVKQDVKTEATPARAGSYIGNRNSKVFHKAGCPSVASMSETNKVSFNSRDAAVSQGYKPCGRCKP